MNILLIEKRVNIINQYAVNKQEQSKKTRNGSIMIHKFGSQIEHTDAEGIGNLDHLQFLQNL